MKTKLMTIATLALVLPGFALVIENTEALAVTALGLHVSMTVWNIIGYVASALVLTAFCMKEMIPLRVVGVCSNVAFLTYGLALGLVPVWSLHAILLPINCWRLWESISTSQLGSAHRSGDYSTEQTSRIDDAGRLEHRDDDQSQQFPYRF
jgi:hypothetical protein